MNIDALRVFCEVVQERSFSRAAARLGITQSGVSQAVAQLEKELGQQLIDRRTRPTTLTPAGERFYPGCRDALDRLQRSVTAVREFEITVCGPLIIAAGVSFGLYQRRRLEAYGHHYPAVEWELRCLRTPAIHEAVARGEATLGIAPAPREGMGLCWRHWQSEPLRLICPLDHPWAKRRGLGLNLLGGESFIAYQRHLPLRRIVDAALYRHGVEVQLRLELEETEAIKQAVRLGYGVALVPEGSVIAEDRLATVAIDGAEISRELGFCYRGDPPLPTAGERLIEWFQDNRTEAGVDRDSTAAARSASPR